ncbi:MAG TPA: glycosyltransferase family 4 protein [Candidatus Paceibacterota bacterium]|nr:glycosyltransferase family 4 protein [Candidatus Paceibacterota bacterium]
MRICFISQNVKLDNGSGRFAHSMISTLTHEYGIEPVILIERGEQPVLPHTYAVLFKRNPLLTFLVNPLLIAWYARGCAFMHAFDGWPYGVMTYIASCMNGEPYSMSLFATYAVAPLYRARQRPLMIRAYRRSKLNAAISHITARKLHDAWQAMPVAVVLQGIDYNAYQTPRPTSIPSDTPFILTVGTLKQRKGYHYALPAFAALYDAFPHLKYVIVASSGIDSYAQRMEKLIDKLIIRESVILLKGLSENELIGLYQHALAFFLPSVSVESRDYFEGFGSVYLEAQACGTPVVTSRGGGQEDALIDGRTGYLVPEGDVDGYVTALAKIVDDTAHRSELSRAAKGFAASMDWKNNIKPYVEIFNRYGA